LQCDCKRHGSGPARLHGFGAASHSRPLRRLSQRPPYRLGPCLAGTLLLLAARYAALVGCPALHRAQPGANRNRRRTRALPLVECAGTHEQTRSKPASPSNGRATIESRDPPLSTPTATPAVSRPFSATQRRRSLRQADLKISNIFG
jgi:hypothetical protein